MTSLDWSVLKSDYIWKDRYISLRADRCRMPSGQVVEQYYIIERKNWVHIVAVTKKRDVVLARQYRHGIQKTIVELPGGGIEDGDSPLQAAKHELLEETGYTSQNFIEVGRFAPNPADHTNISYCFLATEAEYTGKTHQDDTEQIETVLMPIGKLVEQMRSSNFVHGLHFGVLFFALDKLGILQFNQVE